MATLTEILKAAQERARRNALPYEGALTPVEANEVLQRAPGAKIVDVRSRAELDFVGRIPGAVEIEWKSYPGMKTNPAFLAELEHQVEKEALTMFICRSGARSHDAAIAAQQAGYIDCYNVLEGFEGDRDGEGHRNTVNGWRACRLPWSQS